MREWQESRIVTDAKIRAIDAVTRYAIRRAVFRCRPHCTPEEVFDAAGIVRQRFDVGALRTVLAFLCDCHPSPPAQITFYAFYLRRLLDELAEREDELRPLLIKRCAA